MKKRIVALILTIVMSILALTSCGSFNFAEEDLTPYASFDYAAFKAALQKIEIEDGDFTTDETVRAEKLNASVYNAVADKIIAATYKSDWVKTGELGKGDVLYFTYYAVDEKTGNVYFTSDMNESAITASSTKANHVIKLGDVDKENKFLTLIKEELAKNNVDITDYIYDMETASDLTGDDLKVKAGDTIVISYTRSYSKSEGEGDDIVTTIVNESAAYETITLNAEDAFHAFFLHEDSVAKVGSTLEVLDKKDEEGKVTTKKSFQLEIDGVKYTYNNVKIQWRVKTAGKEIATFKYTPYDSTKKVSVDNLFVTADAKQELKDVELTYHVYPVYVIKAPAADEITAADVLTYVYGSRLVESSFDAFKDDKYVNGDKKVADLLKEIANIYDTKNKENELYKDGEMKTLLDAYNKAVEDGGSKPSADKQKVIDETKEALTKAQLAALKEVVAKIVAATNGTEKLGDVVFEQYKDDTFHSLKEAYDKDITEKVQAAVWKLIEESVKVTSYPEKLLKEYKDHLYESYEYEYYKGDFSSTVKNRDKYDTLQGYFVATLKIDSIDKLDAALEKEAKSYLDPIIKIYVVAKACEADAKAVLPTYIQADIDGGAYKIDVESYKEIYGDKAADKIAEAEKNAKESADVALKEADMFIVDEAYMKSYKKEIGRAYYRNLVAEYGEINLRASFQFNRLFYYLTSTNIDFVEEEGHTEVVYKDGYLDFRTISYQIKAPATEDAENSENTEK